MCPPNRQSVARISEELGIYVITLDKWRKTWRLGGGGSAGIPQGPRGLECCRQVHGGTGECWAEGHRAQRLLAGSGSASNASASCSCTPITAAPCVPPRWRCGWRRSGSCASYRARGCRTTTPTPWRCSALPNTGRSTPVGPLPARMRPANGRLHSSTGTCISIATVRSNSRPRSCGTAARLHPFATSARRSTSRPASAIPDVGHDRFAAGDNRALSGSMNQPIPYLRKRSYYFYRQLE